MDARWSMGQRPFLAAAATPAPTVVSTVGPEYYVPVDPMDELQCDSCQ